MTSKLTYEELMRYIEEENEKEEERQRRLRVKKLSRKYE